VSHDTERSRSLGRDELVGVSMAAGVACSADLIAGDEVTLLILPGGAVRALLARQPELGLRMVAQLAGLVEALTDELEELRFCELDARLTRLLQRLGRGRREIQLTHEELAEQVGATRENVSRALKRLERRGALRCRRGRVELL